MKMRTANETVFPDGDEMYQGLDQPTPEAMRKVEKLFSNQHPDYMEAKKALYRNEAAMLVRELGMDTLGAIDTVRARFESMADQMLAQGKDPAAKIYELAHQKGYMGKSQTMTDVEEYEAYQRAMGRVE